MLTPWPLLRSRCFIFTAILLLLLLTRLLGGLTTLLLLAGLLARLIALLLLARVLVGVLILVHSVSFQR